jgi:hypothetical protein
MHIRDLIEELTKVANATSLNAKVILRIGIVDREGEVDVAQADDFDIRIDRGRIVLDGED